MMDFSHHPEQKRYEAKRDGEVLGTIDYELDGSTMTITHTNTDPKASGQGIAGQLTAFVLGRAREQKLTVIPQCPYVAAYIEKHPEYADLL